MGIHEVSERVINCTDLKLAESVSIMACGLNLGNGGDVCQGNRGKNFLACQGGSYFYSGLKLYRQKYQLLFCFTAPGNACN